jgi:serine/threonine-protein kinase
VSPERWERVAEIFGSAMDAGTEDRERIVIAECAGDEEFEREVRALLAADTPAESLQGVVQQAMIVLSATASPPTDLACDALKDAGVGIGAQIDGRYQIVRILGSGGMGVVIEAVHTALDERVAIKLLSARALSTERARARFIREGRAAAKMRSAHIVKIRDVGTLPSGAPFMVMDLLDGADLAAVRAARGRLPYREAVMIALQVCEALATAHAAGVVHRDIKPGNLFLERARHGDVVVKLLDFGISKLLDDSGDDDGVLTRSSELVGSPAYMSPEQLRSSRDVDERADIWSLGVVLYELLAGARPFAAKSFAELCTKVLQQEPPPLTGPWPEELASVVSRCMTREAHARYRDVGALAVALAPFCGADGHRIARRVVRTLGQEPIAPRDLPVAISPGNQDATEAVDHETIVGAAVTLNETKKLGWRPVALVVAGAIVLAGGWWLAAQPSAVQSGSEETRVLSAPADDTTSLIEETAAAPSASASAVPSASASAEAAPPTKPPTKVDPRLIVAPPSATVDPYGSRK